MGRNTIRDTEANQKALEMTAQGNHLLDILFSHSMPCISVLLKCPSLPLPSGTALCSLELSRPGSPWVGDHILGSSTSWRFPAGWVGSSHHPDSCFLMFLGVLRVSCLFLLFGSLHDIISSLVLDKFYPKVNGTSEDTLKLPEVEAFLVSGRDEM